jgi:linoleate 9S-lipoxygenase
MVFYIIAAFLLLCCYNLRTNQCIMAETGLGKTAGEESYLKWNPFDGPIASDRSNEITFKWNSGLGVPGAFLIKNMHSREFFLKSLTLDIPGQGKLHFKCNSWITPYETSKTERIFFSNKVWLFFFPVNR